MNLPARITIREVGARDGLQSEAPLDVDDRLELLDALLIAGVTHLEVAAFVSPAAVPAMAGAADVVAGLGAPEGVVRAALVPNVRGLVVGRALLFPPDGDVAGAITRAASIVRPSA